MRSHGVAGGAVIGLELSEWRDRAQQHEHRVEAWVASRRQRKQMGATHPVDDFLFDYYPYSITKLQHWHPGFGFELLGTNDELRSYHAHRNYHRTSRGVTADQTGLIHHLPRLRLVQRLLHATQHRTEPMGCFGMHEWAMVYDLDPGEVRHSGVPLRLSPEKIKATVDEVGLRCTHIDAYRFFTAAAIPMNAKVLTRESQSADERSGCLHANMDLYKYAMWFSPFIGSDLIADAFALARDARSLDMRAAPYDLSNFGYESIRLETPEGRRAYAREQREIAHRAQPLRHRLIEAIDCLMNVATSEEVLSQDSKSQLDPTPA
jgi:hypothetical protein